MIQIRKARPADIPVILELIAELALYEREPDAAQATAEDLLRDGFGPDPYFHCLIAEVPESGVAAGFALYMFNYSTWLGRPGLYLEDLFIRTDLRGKGYGKALLRALAAEAQARNCGRMEWRVLDWNQPAIDFYTSLGGQFLNEWRTVRLEGTTIATLAAGKPTSDEVLP